MVGKNDRKFHVNGKTKASEWQLRGFLSRFGEVCYPSGSLPVRSLLNHLQTMLATTPAITEIKNDRKYSMCSPPFHASIGGGNAFIIHDLADGFNLMKRQQYGTYERLVTIMVTVAM